MQYRKHKTLIILMVLTCMVICACDVEWIGWGGDSHSDPPPYPGIYD